MESAYYFDLLNGIGLKQDDLAHIDSETVNFRSRTQFPPVQLSQTPMRMKTRGKTDFSRSDNTRLRSHRLSFAACFEPTSSPSKGSLACFLIAF